MTWKILSEIEDGVFALTGETFSGSQEQVNEYLESLREQTGICHAAELISE